jgi:inorganic pyrophosphatase
METPSYRAHPWHGIESHDKSQQCVNAYIEIVPSDTVKYELDKESGILKIDRPQKYSNQSPALYGFIPRTYCGEEIAKACMKATGKSGISGDGDPLDICVLTERIIMRGDILLRARPIGGLRMIDNKQADDKIIAVLMDDSMYGGLQDISECPKAWLDRLRHYFLTYKQIPGEGTRPVEITEVYGNRIAKDVIEASKKDYLAFLTSSII